MDFLSDIPDEVNPSDLISWLHNEVLPMIQSTDLRFVKYLGLIIINHNYFFRIVIGDWIENRSRTIEAITRRPYDALNMISLLDPSLSFIDTRLQKDIQAFVPGTPSYFVRNAVISADMSSVSTFGFNDSSTKVSALALKSQLEDLVYLWVNFSHIFMHKFLIFNF